jgi:hypothetical protein
MTEVVYVKRPCATKTILVGTSEGKSQLGRPRPRLVDNVKMDLREREHGVVWTGFFGLRIGTSAGLL